MKKKVISLLAGSFIFVSSASAAPPTVESLSVSLDVVWMMVGALLVFFMHAGFAMVESGFTRSKNTLNILMKNFLTISLASILYLAVGYAIMFGSTFNGFFGTDGFFLKGHEGEIGFFVFQAMFAATCATIISGAVAERMKLNQYLLLTIVMVALVYPVVGHWVWGDGWLASLGFTDFAGSTVVHLTGALGAIVAVKFLGARIGKYTAGKVNAIPGHNIPLGALGVFILWFGWFGFNGGSTLAADPSLIPHVITTTLLSASGGVIASAFYTQLKYKRIDASLTLNGALAGLVGITAGTGDVSVIGAICIGLVSGVLLVEGVQLLDKGLKLDDPVGAIAVHGICGIWGTVAVGLFATSGGLFYGDGISLLSVQVIGILAVIAWTFIVVGSYLFIVTRFTSLRVSKEEEVSGLDFAEHGSSAYELKESIFSEQPSEKSTEFGTGLVQRLNNIGNAKTTEL